MAYLARQLITEALYLSNIVSRDFQTPTGSQINDGLNRLNALLGKKSLKLHDIPYFTYYEFDAVVGQEKYFIPGLLLTETATFNIGTVRYGMNEQGRVDYFGNSRVDNIDSLPFTYHLERTVGGSNLYMYYLPQDTYPIKIMAKFALSEVTLDTDMSLTFDRYYIDYLTYELSSYLCNWFNVMLPPGISATLADYEKSISQLSAPDLSIRKYTAFSGGTPLNWGDVNYGKGYRPSGGIM